MTQLAIDIIKNAEGLHLTAYFDSTGKPTIGWGHTATVTATDVYNKRTITLSQAEALFASDVAKKIVEVTSLLSGIQLTQTQFDSLVSFAFNFGKAKLASSTLLKKVKSNPFDYEGIASQFRLWVNAGGKKLDGLVARREKEIALYQMNNLLGVG